MASSDSLKCGSSSLGCVHVCIIPFMSKYKLSKSGIYATSEQSVSHVTIRFYLLLCDDLAEAGIPLAYPSVEFRNTHWIGFESNPQSKATF